MCENDIENSPCIIAKVLVDLSGFAALARQQHNSALGTPYEVDDARTVNAESKRKRLGLDDTRGTSARRARSHNTAHTIQKNLTRTAMAAVERRRYTKKSEYYTADEESKDGEKDDDSLTHSPTKKRRLQSSRQVEEESQHIDIPTVAIDPALSRAVGGGSRAAPIAAAAVSAININQIAAVGTAIAVPTVVAPTTTATTIPIMAHRTRAPPAGASRSQAPHTRARARASPAAASQAAAPAAAIPQAVPRRAYTHRVPANGITGNAPVRNLWPDLTADQIVSQHPRDVRGGTLLAIQAELMANGGKGKAKQIRELVSRCHGTAFQITSDQMRQAFTIAYRNEREDEDSKDSAGAPRRCQRCAGKRILCSIRESNGTAPCRQCQATGSTCQP